MASVEDQVNSRIKCRAYKNEENPDGRSSLCGEKLQHDEDGREFFEVPGHQKKYLSELLPSYEFTETYEVGAAPAQIKNKGGRPRKG